MNEWWVPLTTLIGILAGVLLKHFFPLDPPRKKKRPPRRRPRRRKRRPKPRPRKPPRRRK